MTQKWPVLIGVLAAVALLSSCARDQQLVTITIQPANGTFLSPTAGGEIHFTAIGSYIHPPVTKDITSQVTWQTNIPQIININAGAVTTTGNGCGIANISASSTKGTGPSGNLVIAYATVTVNDPSVPGCPGSTASQVSVVVELRGMGIGTVVSTPSGINCPAVACGAQFPANSSVILNATLGSGATTVVWTNCTPSGNNACTLVVGSSPVVVTATFQ